MIQKNPNLIKADIDDALKATIFDWFQWRYVADEEKFPVFFNRLLNNYYKTYQQLLRIQPGYAEYDWLVGNYMEKETTLDNSQVTKGSSSVTNGSTQTVTGHVQKGGQDSTDVDTKSVRTPETTTTIDYDGEEENVRTGSEDNTRTLDAGKQNTKQTTRNIQQRETTTSGMPEQMTSSYSSSRGANKSGPMDAGVSTQGTESLPSTNTFSMGTIEDVKPEFNTHASSIQQTANTDKELVQSKTDERTTERYTIPAGATDGGDTVINASDGYTDTETNHKQYTNVADRKSYLNRKDTRKETGTETNSGTTTTTFTAGQKEDNNSTTKNDGTSETTNDNTVTSRGNNRDRLTGRTEPPADILNRAVSFIETSVAWDWLYPRLETCFQLIYEV